MDWLFARTRKKADEKISKYEYLGLFVFVALPVPFTGAWTGALIAYLFNLKFSRSLLAIFLGLIFAAAIMIVLTIYISASKGGGSLLLGVECQDCRAPG